MFHTRYSRHQVRQMSTGSAYATGFSKTVILFIETGVLITASQVGRIFTLVRFVSWSFCHRPPVSSSIISKALASISFLTCKCLWLYQVSPTSTISESLTLTLQGILPTLIIVVVHFELAVGPITSRSSQSRSMTFEARPGRIAQLDTFVSSTAQSEDTGRSTKPKEISAVV